MEFEKNFEEFAAYARAQGAPEEEIQKMKVELLDSLVEVITPEVK